MQCLGYFSYLLLIVMSFECMQHLALVANWSNYLLQSFVFATVMTISSFLMCWFIFYSIKTPTSSVKINLALMLSALLNMGKALLAIGFGAALYFTPLSNSMSFIDSWYLLLIFMVFIGIDSQGIGIKRGWLNIKILLLPLSAILGSMLAAIGLYYLTQPEMNLWSLLALSQGHGFYSMSGIIMTKMVSPELGTFALMIDLFRELIAILMLYAIGWRYPRSSICAAGATSMDATLPMIKQSCGSDFIPYALMSGLILTLIAPIMVSVLAAI